MIKNNTNTRKSRTKSKVKQRKKIVTNISFCFWNVWSFVFFFSFFRIMYGFLIIHEIALLEFKQALKNFLDLKIYWVFIKQFDQIKRKTKKIQKREKEIKRMGKNHKCR